MDGLRMKGSFEGILEKADGSVLVTRKDNLILDAGFDYIANVIGLMNSRPALMGYTAVGMGTSVVSPMQVGLERELFRKEAAYAHVAGTRQFTFTTVFNPGEATGAITEAGICNAVSGGTFLDRVTFDVINKGVGDTFTSNFEFTLSQSQ